MAAMKHRWEVARVIPPDVLQQLAPLPPLLAQLLFNRGLKDLQEIEGYLSDEHCTPSPFLLPGMSAAVERVRQALRRQELIAVYGDFDLDGITATTLLVQVLRGLGARVQHYIPDRFREGYGLNRSALKTLAEQESRLVVTVDCGTRAHDEIRYANSLGLDVIITDHHDIRDGEGLPPALSVVNPKRDDSRYPFRDLSGVGVAFRLADALLRVNHRIPIVPKASPLAIETYLDLVALGTVGDVVPLVGENRSLVRRGIAQLQRTERPGLRALMKTCRVIPSDLDAKTIGYRLGPRLNAAGRLRTAGLAHELLSTESEEKATGLAQTLDGLNRERQSLTAAILEDARSRVQSCADEMILIACGESYHRGVVGLVASRLCDERYRPSVVVEVGQESSRGSARSIPGFHMTHALDQCSDLLQKHGGHSMAAGFSVASEDLETLKSRLQKVALEQVERDGVELVPTLRIDADLTPDQISYDTLNTLGLLQPFGEGNQEPRFVTRGLVVRSMRIVKEQHIQLRLSDGTNVWQGIAFRQAEKAPRIGSRVDIVYHLQNNVWNGDESLQLEIVDLVPSAA